MEQVGIETTPNTRVSLILSECQSESATPLDADHFTNFLVCFFYHLLIFFSLLIKNEEIASKEMTLMGQTCQPCRKSPKCTFKS